MCDPQTLNGLISSKIVKCLASWLKTLKNIKSAFSTCIIVSFKKPIDTEKSFVALKRNSVQCKKIVSMLMGAYSNSYLVFCC